MASTAPATNILNGYPVRNFDTLDPGAVALANEIKGGHHQYATLAERDAMSVDRREEFMLCSVGETGITYQLQGGIENSDWQNFFSNDDQSIADLEDRMTEAEADIVILQQSTAAGFVKGYATLAELNADLAHDVGSMAMVTDDPDPLNNGTYRKLGASGTGSWFKTSDDLYGRMLAVEKKTEDDSTGEVYIGGQPVVRQWVDPNGRSAITLFASGRLRVHLLDVDAFSDPEAVKALLGLQGYSELLAKTEDDRVGELYVEGKRVVRAWQDPQERNAMLIWSDGVTRIQKLNVAGFDNLSEVKSLLGIGTVPANIAERALTKYNSGTAMSPWEAMAMSAHRKVDIVMVGDSNQLHSGQGWDTGWGKAFEERWRMYASPLYFNNRFTVGYSTSAQSLGNQVTPPPSPYESYFITCTSLADGVVETDGAGIIVTSSSKLNVNSALRWESLYATMTTGSGTFTPRARMEVTPFTSIVLGTPVNTNTGVDGVARVTLDIPAGTRNYNIKAGAQCGPSTATGPIIMFSERLIDTLADSGFSSSTWVAEAGQGLWDMVGTIQGYNHDAAIAFFTELRRVQAASSGTPVFVFIVNSGLNDRNAGAGDTSRGWRALGGSTAVTQGPSAYQDNMEALVDYVETIWESQAWPIEELHWIIIPSHRISDPDDSKLINYRKASRSSLAMRERCAVVDIGQIMTAAEALANGWYQSGGADPIHMTPAGHQAIAERIMVNHEL